MTSIEWLWEQIDGIIPYQDIKTSQLFNGVLEQAKEMEKQQIIDAYQSGDGDAYNLDDTKQWGEEYYNETYGSKGSDNSPKEIKKDSFGKIRFTEEEWAELNNASKGSDGHELDDDIPPTSQYFPTSSQTEISDEEIEKEAELYQFTDGVNSFKFAIQWYKEQLKKL